MKSDGCSCEKNNWGYFVEDEARFVERVFGRFFRQTEDQIGNRYDDVMDSTNRIIIKRAFHKVLDFLEIMINDGHDTMHFLDRTKELFEQHGAAYWLDTSQRPYQFFLVPPRNRETPRERLSRRSAREHARRVDAPAPSGRTHQCAAVCRLDRRQHPRCRIRRAL